MAILMGAAVMVRAWRLPAIAVAAHRMKDSNWVAVEIREDAPDRVCWYAVEMLASTERGWAVVGRVPLGTSQESVGSDERERQRKVEFPDRPPPWKVRVVYKPAFGRVKLLGYRIVETWRTKSIENGFRFEGWEGSRSVECPVQDSGSGSPAPGATPDSDPTR
ncbi:MAG: hypothetical protein JNL10_22800 [Verrucomicrobiales bacterium]|nr:hypothetical protein [Verrucomicrobiales bacterium]